MKCAHRSAGGADGASSDAELTTAVVLEIDERHTRAVIPRYIRPAQVLRNLMDEAGW